MIDPTSDAGRVHATDMAFSLSSFIFALTAYTQTIIFPSDTSLRSTRLTVAIIAGLFIAAGSFQLTFKVRFESYAGLSLVQFAGIIPGSCSLVKYFYQIRSNVIKRSTAGVSWFAIWTDFFGNVCCGIQLQIQAMVAGYAFFITDPHFNLAKALIATFGTVNTLIILIQIHIVYPYSTVEHVDEFKCLPLVFDEEILSERNKLTQPLLEKKYGSEFSENSALRATEDTRDCSSNASHLSNNATSPTRTLYISI